MLPALERCGLILSRLLGLARFHESGEPIGFTSAEISRLIDILSSLTLVCHRILLCVMEELELFWTFSSWLRLQIDLLATSNPTEEISEKEALMDNSKVLRYIQDYLLSSPLGLYFDQVSKADWTHDWDHVEDGSSLLEMLDKQLKRQESGLPYMKALPRPEFLVDYLSKRAEGIFKNISEAQKRSVRFDNKPVKIALDGGDIAKYDMRTVPVKKDVMIPFPQSKSRALADKV